MYPPERYLTAALYRSLLGPSGIPDSTDFHFKLLGKQKSFSLPRVIHFGEATLLYNIYWSAMT